MTFTGTLLPYQESAVRAMVRQGRMLVAYDLGLGKTVITIAACEQIRDNYVNAGPVLVVALASLKYQWAKEITRFSDATVQVIDGSKAKRQQQIMDAWEQGVDYVVTNYESVVNDWAYISELPCLILVLDEATAIKSFRSKRSKRIKELSKNTAYRFALTGTPVENGRPEEIYSIMQAIEPKLLGRFDIFDRTFIVRNQWGAPERYRNLNILHDRLATNMIRKTQTDPDVSPHLPDTIHRDPQLVTMDKSLRQVYRDVGQDLIEELEEAISSFGNDWSLSAHYGVAAPNQPPTEMMGSLMSRVTLLRQLCSHPALVIESADKFLASYERALEGDGVMRGGGSLMAHELLLDDDVRKTLERAKVKKLDALNKIIDDHLDSDDDAKVVVFTSFVLTSEYLRRPGSVVYSGQMNAQQKEEAKTIFQTDPEVRMLISTDAGGYGVDLPQANLLINYDLPWSAGKAAQRNGRIRRASSRWPTVVIQDLLVDSSIEVRQFDLLNQKTSVAGAIVDGRGFDAKGGFDFSAGSLLNHLRETV